MLIGSLERRDDDEYAVYMTNIDNVDLGYEIPSYEEPPPPYTPHKPSDQSRDAPPPYQATNGDVANNNGVGAVGTNQRQDRDNLENTGSNNLENTENNNLGHTCNNSLENSRNNILENMGRVVRKKPAERGKDEARNSVKHWIKKYGKNSDKRRYNASEKEFVERDVQVGRLEAPFIEQASRCG